MFSKFYEKIEIQQGSAHIHLPLPLKLSNQQDFAHTHIPLPLITSDQQEIDAHMSKNHIFLPLLS